MLQVLEQRFSPAAHDEDHGEAGCPLSAHGGPQWSRHLPAARGMPRARPDVCLKETVTPCEAHAGAGSCQELRSHGEKEAHTRSGLLARLVNP